MRTHFETREDQGLTIKHLNTVGVAKKMRLKPLSITKVMVTTKSSGLLHLEPDSNLVTKWCLPSKNIIEAYLIVHSLFSSLTPLRKNNVLRNISYWDR